MSEYTEAWGAFVKLGYIRDWDKDHAIVAFKAFQAGVAAEQSRIRNEMLSLTAELRGDLRTIFEGQ